MGDLQNIHTALSLFYKFHMRSRDKHKRGQTCVVAIKKNPTGEIIF